MNKNLIKLLGYISIKIKKIRVAVLMDHSDEGVIVGKGIAMGLE